MVKSNRGKELAYELFAIRFGFCGFCPWNSLKTRIFVSSFKAFASPKYLLLISTNGVFALYLIQF